MNCPKCEVRGEGGYFVIYGDPDDPTFIECDTCGYEVG